MTVSEIISWIMVCFSLLGALDRIFGSRLGLGKEFERGIMLLGTMALSMVGMIVISPLIAELLRPALEKMAEVLPIDPSIVPATLFANDMGGAPLATELAVDEKIGYFNGLVVSSMMGATISFTIPVALGMVYKVFAAVKIPIIGIGGVSSAEDALEMMMAGATAVGVGAANLIDPYASKKIVEDLPRVMEKYGIENLTDIIGAAHNG